MKTMFSHFKMGLVIVHYISCYVQSILILKLINSFYTLVVFPLGRKLTDVIIFIIVANVLFLVEFPLWDKRMK